MRIPVYFSTLTMLGLLNYSPTVELLFSAENFSRLDLLPLINRIRSKCQVRKAQNSLLESTHTLASQHREVMGGKPLSCQQRGRAHGMVKMILMLKQIVQEKRRYHLPMRGSL